jgi:hypothetical protein
MYRVEKQVDGRHAAMMVCAESREAALTAARQLMFDKASVWGPPDEVVPLVCAEEPVPVVQVRQHAAARIEYLAYAKPPDDAAAEVNGPLDVQHLGGHRYRMLGMFYAANDTKAYEVRGNMR